jgi:hypothetical protein
LEPFCGYSSPKVDEIPPKGTEAHLVAVGGVFGEVCREDAARHSISEVPVRVRGEALVLGLGFGVGRFGVWGVGCGV